MEKFEKLNKESKLFVMTAAMGAFMFFVAGIDSILDQGLFFKGLFVSAIFGLVSGLITTASYSLLKRFAPDFAKKLEHELTKDEEEENEDFFLDDEEETTK